jgi:hypothetical protein
VLSHPDVLAVLESSPLVPESDQLSLSRGLTSPTTNMLFALKANSSPSSYLPASLLTRSCWCQL